MEDIDDVSLDAVKDACDCILHNENIVFDEFVNFDNKVAVGKTLTDSEILENVIQTDGSYNVNDEENEDKDSFTVTTNEVRQSLKAVQTPLQKTDIGDHVFDVLVQAENATDKNITDVTNPKENNELFQMMYIQYIAFIHKFLSVQKTSAF